MIPGLTAWVSAHPARTALLTAILVVVVIILLVLTLHYHSKWKAAATQGFDTSAWKYGSVLDSGFTDAPLTPAQLSLYNPQMGGVRSELSRMMLPRTGGQAARNKAAAQRRRMAQRRVQSTNRRRETALIHGGHLPKIGSLHREGLTAAPAGEYSPSNEYAATNGACNAGDMVDQSTGLCGPAGGCNPGDTMDTTSGMCIPAATDSGYLGNSWTFGGSTDTTACTATDEYGNPLVYNANGVPIGATSNGQTIPLDAGYFAGWWDPDATAEAQALASVGSYAVDPSGDAVAFQAAIASALDSDSASATLTDAQLNALMAQGTAP